MLKHISISVLSTIFHHHHYHSFLHESLVLRVQIYIIIVIIIIPSMGGKLPNVSSPAETLDHCVKR